jgi:type I restriction enzyme S subunit
MTSRASIGFLNISNGDVVTNQGFINIECKANYHYKFFYYWILDNRKKLLSLSQGSTFLELNRKTFAKINIPFPPLPEQQKIAAILSTVDKQISTTDKIIEKSKELKKGLMQKLFSEGIGHTEFKDTKIGRIPKDWEVVRFGELIESNCYGPRFSAKDYLDTGNVKTIRGTDINKTGDILYTQVPVAQLPEKLVNTHKLKDGDLVMITTADCGLTGVYFDDGFPYIPSAYAVRLTLNQKALPLYFKYVFQTNLSKKQVIKYIRKGTVANLPGSDILKFTFAHPPLPEQEKIADLLLEADAKIEKEQAQKAQLEQLKKGLMQQLLTGKKRVKV